MFKSLNYLKLICKRIKIEKKIENNVHLNSSKKNSL